MSDLLTLRQVAAVFRSPRTGKRLSVHVVRRWTRKGLAGERLATINGRVERAELWRWRRAVARPKAVQG
jgi:uncharacterized protein YqjF (DUF2071 family)